MSTLENRQFEIIEEQITKAKYYRSLLRCGYWMDFMPVMDGTVEILNHSLSAGLIGTIGGVACTLGTATGVRHFNNKIDGLVKDLASQTDNP